MKQIDVHARIVEVQGGGLEVHYFCQFCTFETKHLRGRGIHATKKHQSKIFASLKE